jgi:hypothetical protein
MAPNEQDPIVGFLDAVQHFARAFALVGNVFLELQRQSELIDKAGFVPHPTMPQDLIQQSSGDPTRLSELLEHYYEENWPKVRDEMMARVKGYQIDNEANEAFQEALIAHEKHLYRSVVRNLFPEIERITITELYEGTRVKNPEHGLKKFFDRVHNLPVGDVVDLGPSGCFGLMQLNRLKKYFYVEVNERNLKQIEADAIPTRHAAIHGTVVYRTAKNSLNTIFITDHIYQVVDFAKRYLAQQKVREEARSRRDAR